MTRLDQIAPRLKKLLLMLSSDREGEVVNAARLIGTTLRDAGSDWHDLAAGLLTPAGKRQPPPPPPPHDDAGDWRTMRGRCLAHSYLLAPREREFLLDLERWRGSLTEKQFAWLAAIHTRVQRRGRS
jgi:hypothetical protein